MSLSSAPYFLWKGYNYGQYDPRYRGYYDQAYWSNYDESYRGRENYYNQQMYPPRYAAKTTFVLCKKVL